jgi:hypothetical protein
MEVAVVVSCCASGQLLNVRRLWTHEKSDYLEGDYDFETALGKAPQNMNHCSTWQESCGVSLGSLGGSHDVDLLN